MKQCQGARRCKEIQEWKNHQRRNEEKQGAATLRNNMDNENGKEDAPGSATEFLVYLHATDDLLNVPRWKIANVRKTGNHADRVLDGTERQSVAAGEQQCGYQCGSQKGWTK